MTSDVINFLVVCPKRKTMNPQGVSDFQVPWKYTYISPSVHHDRLENVTGQGREEEIVAGDFNAKATKWGPPTTGWERTSLARNKRKKWMAVQNKGDTPTFQTGQSPSLRRTGLLRFAPAVSPPLFGIRRFAPKPFRNTLESWARIQSGGKTVGAKCCHPPENSSRKITE